MPLTLHDEGGEPRPVLCPFVVAGEERIFSVESQGPDQVLDRITVHLDAAVIEIDAEPIPMVGQIG